MVALSPRHTPSQLTHPSYPQGFSSSFNVEIKVRIQFKFKARNCRADVNSDKFGWYWKDQSLLVYTINVLIIKVYELYDMVIDNRRFKSDTRHIAFIGNLIFLCIANVSCHCRRYKLMPSLYLLPPLIASQLYKKKAHQKLIKSYTFIKLLSKNANINLHCLSRIGLYNAILTATMYTIHRKFLSTPISVNDMVTSWYHDGCLCTWVSFYY